MSVEDGGIETREARGAEVCDTRFACGSHGARFKRVSSA